MNTPAPKPTAFLAKESYRRRRMRDLARAVPIIGAILLAIPLLWAEGARNSSATVYIFIVWILLIAMSAVISRVVSTNTPMAP